MRASLVIVFLVLSAAVAQSPTASLPSSTDVPIRVLVVDAGTQRPVGGPTARRASPCARPATTPSRS